MQLTEPVWPIHCNGGAGHDNIFPVCILMPLANHVLKIDDKGDCNGRKGPVDTYVCGVLIETGVWKVMMRWQTS